MTNSNTFPIVVAVLIGVLLGSTITMAIGKPHKIGPMDKNATHMQADTNVDHMNIDGDDMALKSMDTMMHV